MNYFLAVNDRQLGTCLRMLFAEKLQPAVQTVLNEKGKIEFHISIEEAMPMKVKSRMSCPVRRKDGTWTTVIREFEEDIPDLGREDLICNKCGRPDYPKCKETVCEAWKYHESKK